MLLTGSEATANRTESMVLGGVGALQMASRFLSSDSPSAACAKLLCHVCVSTQQGLQYLMC